jgi:hypothetical protein
MEVLIYLVPLALLLGLLGLVAMGGRTPGWMKRRAIESTGLFGWSFWVDDVKTGG